MDQNLKILRKLLIPAILSFIGISIILVQIYIDPVLDRDSFKYLKLIEEWETLKEYPYDIQTIVPPLYFVCVKWVQCSFISIVNAGILISLISYYVSSWLIFFIARELHFSYKISIAAMSLFLFHPMTMRISRGFIRDSFFLCLEIASLYILMKAIKCRRNLLYSLLGCLLGGAVLVRFEGFIFSACITCMICVGLFYYKSITSWNAVCCLLSFGVCVTIVSFAVLGNCSSIIDFFKIYFIYIFSYAHC